MTKKANKKEAKRRVRRQLKEREDIKRDTIRAPRRLHKMGGV